MDQEFPPSRRVTRALEDVQEAQAQPQEPRMDPREEPLTPEGVNRRLGFLHQGARTQDDPKRKRLDPTDPHNPLRARLQAFTALERPLLDPPWVKTRTLTPEQVAEQIGQYDSRAREEK